MNTKMKKELLNDVLTGLAVAAAYAAVVPAEAFAQLSNSVNLTQAAVAAPAMQYLGMLSYALGAVMVVSGVAGAKKHADNPGSNPLGPAIGKLGAGAAFLAAPTVIGMMAATGTAAVSGTGTFTPNSLGFQ